MKIAVTSQNKHLTSLIDSRFGRSAFILFVDTDTMSFESIDNSKNKNSFKNAGINTANAVLEYGAKILITGFCGPNAFNILKTSGIKVADRVNGRVIDVVENYKSGQLVFSNHANTEAYW